MLRLNVRIRDVLSHIYAYLYIGRYNDFIREAARCRNIILIRRLRATRFVHGPTTSATNVVLLRLVSDVRNVSIFVLRAPHVRLFFDPRAHKGPSSYVITIRYYVREVSKRKSFYEILETKTTDVSPRVIPILIVKHIRRRL